MRTVFAGTPPEAVPSLEALNRIGEVDLVITRPDRPRGRSRAPRPPAVKTAAVTLGLPVAQPSTAGELEEVLGSRSFDVGVVVAFGMILRPRALATASAGFLNVHFSLLPRWRGAAPVERAIMAGDTSTGVSIMVMDEGLDTGPVIAREPTPIHADDTGGSLRERLADMGASLLSGTVAGWFEGELEALPQDPADATYAARIEPGDRLLGSHMSVIEFVDRVRALSPTPGARLRIGTEYHKILRVTPVDHGLDPGAWDRSDGLPMLGVAGGSVLIREIQPPGKRPMTGEEWLRGRRLPQ